MLGREEADSLAWLRKNVKTFNTEYAEDSED